MKTRQWRVFRGGLRFALGAMTAHVMPVRRASFREPARRRGRGSALRLAERWSAKPKRYENAPVGAFSAEGSASHLRHDELSSAGETGFLPRTSSTTRETHLPARYRRRSRNPLLRCRHADPTPPDAFPAARCVASLAMVRFRKPVSTADRTHACGAKCAWKRRAWRFPRRASPGEVSPTVEESVSSLSPRGSHVSRCVSGFVVIRVARDGSLQEACLPG